MAVASPTPTPSVTATTGIGTATTSRIVVTGGEIEQSSTDTAQAVTVLNDAQLKELAAPGLGDTLATQPGVAASGFAPGASRPGLRLRFEILNSLAPCSRNGLICCDADTLKARFVVQGLEDNDHLNC